MASKGHMLGCPAESFDECRCEEQRYVYLALTTLLILSVQLWGGHASGSLGLFADSVHVALDGAGALIGVYVVFAVRNAHTAHDLEEKGTRLSAQLLLVALAFIVYHAVERLIEPHAVIGNIALLAAGAGALLNVLQFFLLRDGLARGIKKAQMLHVLSDLLSSGAVCAGAFVVWQFGWNQADAIASLVAVMIVSFHAIPLAFGKHHHHHH